MDDSLTIPGAQVDKVSYAGEAIPSTATMDEMLSIVRSWERSVTNGIYLQDVSRVQEDLRITIDNFITAITCQIREAVSEDIMPPKYGSTNAVSSRTFFTTENGFMGLGPASMTRGDIVCFGLGCSNLLILHPVDERKHYTICGDACISGLLFGKGLLGPVVPKSEAINSQ
ncbi:hypothetical protein DL95DRAFT_406538 [Leptodontidium sp. 2 PMI_412]|nr:hypothetical protein DL95DRAFT_406538 [Leptodontidium sp. 2 PMI_412]